MNHRVEQLKSYIRDVPDFPKAGIIFKDITPLIGHPEGLRQSLELLLRKAKRRPCQIPRQRLNPLNK